jgi:hypothetical protein
VHPKFLWVFVRRFRGEQRPIKFNLTNTTGIVIILLRKAYGVANRVGQEKRGLSALKARSNDRDTQAGLDNNR